MYLSSEKNFCSSGDEGSLPRLGKKRILSLVERGEAFLFPKKASLVFFFLSKVRKFLCLEENSHFSSREAKNISSQEEGILSLFGKNAFCREEKSFLFFTTMSDLCEKMRYVSSA